MKKIEAIIRPSRLEYVKDALQQLDIESFTYWEVHGIGNQKGKEAKYRGAVSTDVHVERLKIELLVPADKAELAAEEIVRSARTGNVGDGIVLISDLNKMIHIRTHTEGDSAFEH